MSEIVLVVNLFNIGLFIKVIKDYKFTFFTHLNTLFVGLMDHPDFKKLDFSHLRITLSGGTTLQMQKLKSPSRLYVVPENSSEKAEAIIS